MRLGLYHLHVASLTVVCRYTMYELSSSRDQDDSLPVAIIGFHWVPVVLSGYWPVVLNGCQWFSMVTSGSQWLPVVASGSQ